MSGLLFAQVRYYDANVGRFQSEDRVKGFLNGPFTLNHYGYCWGNPISFLDLDGNWHDWLISLWNGTSAHNDIGLDLQQRFGKYYDIETNVFIEQGREKGDSYKNGYADVVMYSQGDNTYYIYEIKPEGNTSGTNQLGEYVDGFVREAGDYR